MALYRYFHNSASYYFKLHGNTEDVTTVVKKYIWFRV